MARAIIKRAACCFWLSNYNQAIEDYDKVIHTIRYAEILGEEEIKRAKKDLENIRARQASQETKY